MASLLRPATLLCSSLALLAATACNDDATDPGDDEIGDSGATSLDTTAGTTTADETGDSGTTTDSGDTTTTTTTTADTGDTDTTTTTTADTGDTTTTTTTTSDTGDTGDTTSTDTGDPCGPECCPGETMCEGETSLQCNDDGTEWLELEYCDGVQGVTCNADVGLCQGPCSENALGFTYIGCDYYPTVTQQHDSYNTNSHDYAVAVANVSGEDAMITITQGDNPIQDTVVAAGDVNVIVLPWVNSLTKQQGPSSLVVDGAYRLRSDRPVVVYQYNPLAATTTNDASILLPVNAWGPEVTVASWNHWDFFGSGYPGFYAVVASEDNTTVDLYPSATGNQVQAGGGVAANGTGQVVLDNSDVLQVMTSGGDLTGTIVSADKPIQVIGGHECSNVPLDITACDHLEESIFPTQTLALEYIVTPPVQVPDDNQLKAQLVRVVATEDNTSVNFDPDQGADQVLANAGDFIHLDMTQASFKVSADKPILVVQYMVGQSAGFGTSDPAMLLAVPTAQYRNNYLFHAAPSWQANYVDIIAPDGSAVTVDGANVGGWTGIGATGYSVAHVQLSNAGNGNHEVNSDQKVGISVYGVQSFGSYWYPGGLDLEINPQ